MGRAIRFYADEHIPKAVVAGLRRRGVDVLTTYEAGMLGTGDNAQLAFAAQAERVLITKDDDFLRLHAAGHLHPGIVHVRQEIQVGDMIRGLMLVFDVLDQGEMHNHVEFL